MKHLCATILWAALAALIPTSAGAQTGSVTLNVPHARQEATQLCWAALVSEVLFQNPDGSRPGQCHLVNELNDIKGLNPAGDCCGRLDQEGCNITANYQDIESLLTRFGMKVEKVNVPATPEEVHAYLQSGRVLMLGLQTTPTDNHLYLVRGLNWENGKAVLIHCNSRVKIHNSNLLIRKRIEISLYQHDGGAFVAAAGG
jgi:hypothetical protein